MQQKCLTFLCQLQQASDECHLAQRENKESEVLTWYWQSSLWLVQGVVGVSGQPLEIVASFTTEFDTTETYVDPTVIYTHTHTHISCVE